MDKGYENNQQTRLRKIALVSVLGITSISCGDKVDAVSSPVQSIKPSIPVSEYVVQTSQLPLVGKYESSFSGSWTTPEEDFTLYLSPIPIGSEPAPSEDLPQSIEYINGQVVGQLTIQDIDVSLPIIVGFSDSELNRGFGYHPNTAPLEAGEGISILAGHNVTVINHEGVVTPVLRDLDTDSSTGGKLQFGENATELKVDLINGQSQVYRALRQAIVPNDRVEGWLTINEPLPDDPKRLIALYKCWPDNSTDERYVVFFELVEG